MTSRVLPLAVVTGFAFVLSGCASTSNVESTEPSSEAAASSSSSSSSSSEKSTTASSRSSEEPRRAESAETVASKSSASSEGPRSSWRNERDPQREARGSSVGASGDTARLVEQLNDASRELATLRAQNAKLRAGVQSAPAATSASTTSAAAAAVKADPADEKLAASLKSYAQFKQEMVTIFAEVERARKENAGMSANLKAAVEQVDHARATIAKLEMELRTERKSRADAEYAASQLRDQLRTIARALNSAGLSVEKISSATETASR